MGHGGEVVCGVPNTHQQQLYHHNQNQHQNPQHHHQRHHSNQHHHTQYQQQPHLGGPQYSKKLNSLGKVSNGGVNNHHHQNGKVVSGSGNNSNRKSHSTPKGRQQQQQGPFPLMKQQSLQNARQKSFTPPTLHPVENLRGLSTSPKAKDFYAGARFESHPSHVTLPCPPSHWTAPLQRSHSQPASPVPNNLTATSATTSGSSQKKGMSVDLAALFSKSASYPGESSPIKMKMMSNAVIDNDKVTMTTTTTTFGSLQQAQQVPLENKPVFKASSQDDTDELKKALGLLVMKKAMPVPLPVPVPVISNAFVDIPMSPSKYQDISDQLKNLLKVAA